MKYVILCLTIALLAGCASTAQFDGPIEDHIDVIFSAHKGKESYPVFKKALLAKYREYQNWHPAGHKAFALAWDVDGQHAFGFGYGSASVHAGGGFALKFCNKSRDKNDVGASCAIFAKEGRIVLKSY